MEEVVIVRNIKQEYTNNVVAPNHLIDLNVYQFGYERTQPDYLSRIHVHDHYAFHYVFSGQGTLYVSKSKEALLRKEKDEAKESFQEYFIEAGHGFLILPGYYYRMLSDHTYPWYFAWLEMDGLQAKQYLKKAGFSSESILYLPSTMFAPPHHNILEDHLDELVHHVSPTQPYLIGAVYQIFDDLINSSSGRREDGPADSRDSYVNKIKDYIQEHYAEKISVQEIADAFGLNRCYMAKIFKEKNGMSVHDFLLQCRINAACFQLENNTASISDIAKENGFSDQVQFSKVFKKAMTVSPSQWRKDNLRRSQCAAP